MQSALARMTATEYENEFSSYRGRQAPAVPMKPPLSVRVEVPSRKRPRTIYIAQPSQAEHEEDREEEEEDRKNMKKKARGRPRLDPEDQTPQDRRRTQIRNAQRAYRDRQESTISTLEKNVHDLKDANNQISLAYRKLFVYASRKGLLDGAADFGQHLMQLDAFAKTAGKSSSQLMAELDSSDNAHKQDYSDPPSVAMVRSGSHQTMQPPQHHPKHQLMDGILATHKPSMLPSQTKFRLIPSAPFHGMSMTSEVIAQPTSQNPSFPQTLSHDQSPLSNTHCMQSPAASNTLPNPTSHVQSQFSRRLQQTALQRAATLISMKDPPPESLTLFFGFSHLFETYEQIRERLMACLDRTERGNLSHRTCPVQTVENSNIQLPETHTSVSGYGLNSKISPGSETGRLASRAPFLLGPFEKHIEMIRRSLTSLGDSMLFPGFDGVLWDPDEVDFYMKSNGVHIPPHAKYHTVEIADDAFAGPPPSLVSQTETILQRTVPSSNSLSVTSISQQFPSTLHTPETPTTSRSHSSTGEFNAGLTIPMNVPLDTCQSYIPQAVGEHQLSNACPYVTPTNIPASNRPMAFGDPSILSPTFGHQRQPLLAIPVSCFNDLPTFIQTSMVRKQRWNINVEKFIDELISRTICLGRTPTFRPRDVDVAFWVSVVIPGSSQSTV